jgi:hypothetical protein
MKIKVIDAFGTHVGDAEVKWIANIDQLEQEIADILMPITVAVLPTREARAAWRLEVTP